MKKSTRKKINNTLFIAREIYFLALFVWTGYTTLHFIWSMLLYGDDGFKWAQYSLLGWTLLLCNYI